MTSLVEHPIYLPPISKHVERCKLIEWRKEEGDFIWGVWYVTMGIYLTKIGFHGKEIGAAYSTLAIGAIISSFFVSMVADRYFAAEKLTGVLHLSLIPSPSPRD